MYYRIVEAKTVEETGALYLLVHFWKKKADADKPPVLINDFFLGLDPNEPVEPQIDKSITRYWDRGQREGYEGDHSFKASSDLKIKGRVMRPKGAAPPRPRLTTRDPDGYVAKAKALR